MPSETNKVKPRGAAGAGKAPALIDRLREVGCDHEPFTPDHAKCICRLTNEAADEIERAVLALGGDPGADNVADLAKCRMGEILAYEHR